MNIIDGISHLRSLCSKAITSNSAEELLSVRKQLNSLKELAKKKLFAADPLKREQVSTFIQKINGSLTGVESKLKRISSMSNPIHENTIKIGNYILESISDFFLSETDRPMAELQARRQAVMGIKKAAQQNAAIAAYKLGRAPISMKRNESLIRAKQRRMEREKINRQYKQQNTTLQTQIEKNKQNARNALANVSSGPDVVTPKI